MPLLDIGGRSEQALAGFFNELGPERAGQLEAVRKELVRAISGEPLAQATTRLDAAIRRSRRSRLAPFKKLGLTLRRHRDGILAAVEHGLSNGRLEGLNSRLALINHRAAGFHSASAFIALAMLCVGGFKPVLPHQ